MYFQYLFSSSLFLLPVRFLNGNGTEAQTCRGICGGELRPHSPQRITQTHHAKTAGRRRPAPETFANVTDKPPM